MLLNLGIVSTLYPYRQAAGPRELPGGTYDCHAAHELVISNDNLGTFQQRVGFHEVPKANLLRDLLNEYKRTSNRERFVARVAQLTYLGVEDVYDVTVPATSCFGANGFVIHNCEQTLWDLELCCLVETFPSMCDDYEDYQRTVKFAYLYAKTVTLVPTHHAATNQVMLSNRRIGCSQSGIQDNIEKIGLRAHLDWCDAGYQYIRKLDDIYSGWLCTPQSIKHTSVKPSGTVSKLVGVREGIHESKGEYEFQTIRIHDNSPLIPRLRKANYRIEEAIKEPNTLVVYFPMKYNRKRARNPTMWEQLELAAQMQAHWANNQVSVTIDFDREVEGPEIARALEMYVHRLKGVSFLPTENHFVQAPKTVVTKEEYEEYRETLLPLDLSNLKTHEVDDKFCSSGICEAKYPVTQDAE